MTGYKSSQTVAKKMGKSAMATLLQKMGKKKNPDMDDSLTHVQSSKPN